MDTTTVASVLSSFGITQSRDAQGKLTWVLDIIANQSEGQTRQAYFDSTLAKWRFDERVAGKKHRAQQEQQPHSPPTARVTVQRAQSTPHLDGTDWTSGLLASDHTDFFRNTDWASSPLGHHSAWPYPLRLYVHMLFSDSRATVIYWGQQRVAIYNQHFAPLLDQLHPTLMGKPFASVMPDVWDLFGPIVHAIEANQVGQARNGLEFPLERHGYLEETFWDGSLVSLKDDRGNYGGIYCSWVEATRTILGDRRTALVNRLAQLSILDSTPIWQHVYEVFMDSPRDIPMAIMYDVEDPETDSRQLKLKHTIGIGSDYTAAPETLDLHATGEDHTIGPLLRRARDSATDFILLDLSKDSIDPAIVKNINWRGYGEPSRHVVVIPLRARNLTRGYITLGLNPRRGFDADHEQFVSDLARQFKELMTRITTEGQAQRREQRLMDELTDSERRMSRMAEMTPVGIYDLGVDGRLQWANSHFYDIMGVSPDSRDPSMFDWRDYILLEDQGQANNELTRSMVDKVEISDQLRLKTHWKPPSTSHDPQPADEPFWVLYSASPDLGADGAVKSLMGCITNISHLKWAEQLQARNADAAQQEKQRQEEFIDITSHEMRNPLSAIIHCADGIMASLDDMKGLTDGPSLANIIKVNVEAAESILFCAAHQRRIIDDVLTLGKLDSELLTIAPVAFHPQSLVEEALQMFKTEFESNQISVATVSDANSVLAPGSTVHGDSARLMQVLVNLLTNAIKFTRTEKTRKIAIRLGSSFSAPSPNVFGPKFRWNTTKKIRPDLTREADYGHGEAVYLYYGVTDSGKGIAEESANKVFAKFEQADRRTYTKYGGSGLGLFISRELTEMQGGQIGVESEEGVGSTFAFYTKARCTQDQFSGQTDLIGTDTLAASSAADSTRTKDPKAEDGTSVAVSIASQSFLPAPPNYTVLLVEDNILNQKVLAKQLAKAGSIVYVANNGGEAIDLVLQVIGAPAEYGTLPAQNPPSHFDCILMDWEMPVCDGLIATKRIREIELQRAAARNVIIGVTANARSEHIARAMEAGMDKVVPKPFRVPELLLKIGDLLKSRYDASNGV